MICITAPSGGSLSHHTASSTTSAQDCSRGHPHASAAKGIRRSTNSNQSPPAQRSCPLPHCIGPGGRHSQRIGGHRGPGLKRDTPQRDTGIQLPEGRRADGDQRQASPEADALMDIGPLTLAGRLGQGQQLRAFLFGECPPDARMAPGPEARGHGRLPSPGTAGRPPSPEPRAAHGPLSARRQQRRTTELSSPLHAASCCHGLRYSGRASIRSRSSTVVPL